jgi:two-component system nitrate/nitrite sensor histidine kinase NarX
MKNTLSPETNPVFLQIFEGASDGILITDLETGALLIANPEAAEMHGYPPGAFIRLPLMRLIGAKSRISLNDFSQVITRGGIFEMMAQHVRRNGTFFHVEWRAAGFEYQGKHCALVILRDVSKRVHAEHQLQQRVEVRANEQAALLEISQSLASTLELQPESILEQLRVLIKYTQAGLFTLEDSTLCAVAARGTEQLENLVPFKIRLNDRKTLETLFNEHKPIRIADLESNNPSAFFLKSLLVENSAALLKGMRSWMWVPLAVKNRMIGGIGLGHSEPNHFTTHHAELAMIIANQAAVTLVNAELNEHAQSLAVLQERQRLAQNLHDAVNQSLFSAGLIAEVLPQLWERNPGEARKALEDLRRLTRGAMAEMRALLAELKPSTLTDSELGDLLRLLGNAFAGRTNIPVDVTINGAGNLPAETQVAIYRICQEVLSNIAKHAKASRVEIKLKHAKSGIVLHIHDDGCGFDPSKQTPSGHYGLVMMRERANAVGVELTITSQPGQGTDVMICWGEQEGL